MPPQIPHYKEHRKRMKKKFTASGVDAFHDYEVLELLLSYAIPRKDVKPLAKGLLKKFGSLKGVMDASVRDLEGITGVSTHTAVLVKLVK
ncbi:MAG: hypothetical protein NT022_08730, partial [Deltaproteobacteria bacterium]|nr:hypothetical protein [Deltaproteobacteria bacterium]